jgi:hypothetical protein
MLGLYAAFYISYISVVLLWSILGAILNPEQFLPIASGALVIIVFIIFMSTKLSTIDKTLHEVVINVINDQIKSTIIKSFKSKNVDVLKIISKAESLPQSMFHIAINTFMGKCDLQSVDRSVTDEIMKGDVGAIVRLLNENFGIEYSIALGLIGMLKNDPIIILDSIYKLSEKLDLDPELNITIAEIVLEKFSSGTIDTNKVSNSVILSIKKLLNYFFPDFQSEILDDILQVVIKQDIEPLNDIFTKLGAPPELLKLIIASIKKDQRNIQSSIQKLSKDRLPRH